MAKLELAAETAVCADVTARFAAVTAVCAAATLLVVPTLSIIRASANN